MPSYEELKTLAAQRGCRVTDLIALAPQNDPFYTGKPADLLMGHWFAIVALHAEEIEQLEEEYEAIRNEFEGRLASHNERLQNLWGKLTSELQDHTPDLADYPIPEPDEATEPAEGLYDSQRSYLTQIEQYKNFQRGEQ